jgi:hypothetical protein
MTAAVRRAGLRVKDIQHYFVHQANLNILTNALAQLGVPSCRAPVTVDTLGNTGSAGVFTACTALSPMASFGPAICTWFLPSTRAFNAERCVSAADESPITWRRVPDVVHHEPRRGAPLNDRSPPASPNDGDIER